MLLFSSCEYEDKFDGIQKNQNKSEYEALVVDYTISELKYKFMESDSKILISDNSASNKYAKMFTIYDIPKTEKALIKGIVLSSDIDGNTYKKIVVRDDKDGSAIDISVDASGLGSLWPQGIRVSINTSGLQIGEYANMPCLGSQTYNVSKNRYEIGRIPSTIALDRITSYDMPDKELLKPEVVTIKQILDNKENYYSKLVTIKNVQFGYYTDKAETEDNDALLSNFVTNYVNLIDETGRDVVFSEENALNVPVSRVLKDATGTISLTTSFYAKFASDILPKGKHDITVIVGWYKDQSGRDGNIQLLLQRHSEKYSDIKPVSNK